MLRAASFLRIDGDLVLADEASEGRDFGDAGDGLELVAEEPVLEGAEIGEARFAGGGRGPGAARFAGGGRGPGAGGQGRRFAAGGGRFAPGRRCGLDSARISDGREREC